MVFLTVWSLAAYWADLKAVGMVLRPVAQKADVMGWYLAFPKVELSVARRAVETVALSAVVSDAMMAGEWVVSTVEQWVDRKAARTDCLLVDLWADWTVGCLAVK